MTSTCTGRTFFASFHFQETRCCTSFVASDVRCQVSHLEEKPQKGQGRPLRVSLGYMILGGNSVLENELWKVQSLFGVFLVFLCKIDSYRFIEAVVNGKVCSTLIPRMEIQSLTNSPVMNFEFLRVPTEGLRTSNLKRRRWVVSVAGVQFPAWTRFRKSHKLRTLCLPLFIPSFFSFHSNLVRSVWDPVRENGPERRGTLKWELSFLMHWAGGIEKSGFGDHAGELTRLGNIKKWAKSALRLPSLNL